MLCCFETGSHYVSLACLELTVQTKLALASQRSTCLCLWLLGLKVCTTMYGLSTQGFMIFTL